MPEPDESDEVLNDPGVLDDIAEADVAHSAGDVVREVLAVRDLRS